MKLTEPQRRMLAKIDALSICRFNIRILDNPTFRRLVKKKCLVKSKDYSKFCVGKAVRYDVTSIGRQALKGGE